MSFKTFHSNRVETLSGSLIAELATHPLGDPLAQEFVLVDNRVLGEWLNLQIAQQQGIAANIRYIQPHELFWLLARNLVSASIPRETPLSKEEMTWKLYGLLDDKTLLAQDTLQAVSDYLASEDKRDLKRYQLAGSVADLFDQYMIYRPDWILKWQGVGKISQFEVSEANALNESNEKWQRELFNRLSDRAQTGNSEWPHRALIEKNLLKILNDGAVHNGGDTQKKIPFSRLSVFGITSMPPNLVHLLIGLGHFVEVRAYILNPCNAYWSLISSARELVKKESGSEFAEDQHYEIGNPLLASQGVQIRDFIGLLQNAGDIDPELLFDNADGSEIHCATTLLESIQHDIRDLQYKGTLAKSDYVTAGEKQLLPGKDGNTAEIIPSIHIHNCHSIMREVEVLHDQVRNILACNPDLHPRDIVVMMPRVAPYVACIHAVFNSLNTSRLDYHITDRTQAEESPLLNSLLTLLKLPDSRLPLSEVLSLLEVPALQRRFGINSNDYLTIKRWLTDSGVRWGIDGVHRKTLGLPEYNEFSWQFGLNRLMAGYAMTPGLTDAIVKLADEEQVAPYDQIEGGNSAAFDAFLQFWQALMTWRNILNVPTTPHAWAERLRTLLDAFFDAIEEQEMLAIKTARISFNTLDQAEECKWFSGNISLDVIRSLIQPALDQTVSGKNHWREGIKFCSLMPMRGVPFKVVYILGMNMEDYPRHINKRSFDLMRNRYRPGDRASRIDDRWLFMEALLSARRYFHVSYVGRDIYRNEKREPSVVLSELIDYCKHGYMLPPDYLITQHPLQPFSDKYFRQDKTGLSARLVSYNEEAWHIANAKQQPIPDIFFAENRWSIPQNKMGIGEGKPEVVIVQLNDFIKFFTRPWNWFFTKKHKVWLDDENDGINDEENFGAADALENWQLRQDLIRMINALTDDVANRDAKRDELVEELACLRRAEGRWPLGNGAEKFSNHLKTLKTDYLWASQGQQVMLLPFRAEVDSGIKKLVIEGELPITAGGCLLVHSASKMKIDKELDFYIKLAFAKRISANHPGLNEASACFFDGKAGAKKIQVPFISITEKNNTDFLQIVTNLYLTYWQCGLPFEPELSADIFMLENPDERIEKIDAAWHEKSEWKTGIAYDSKKRAYFGHVDAIKSNAFLSVSEILCQAMKTIENAIHEK